MAFEYKKVKSAAKEIIPQGPELSNLILTTMARISQVVGDSLGPHGRHMALERFEHGLPPILTKDGVTILRSLGFTGAAAQCILEIMRDAAIRTASEAGDGTTTATILSESIVRRIHEFCKRNPRISPQHVVRYLERQYATVIEPGINQLTKKVEASTPEGRSLLRHVANVSANGDTQLAEAVMQCYDMVGDDGNVTIVETAGPSGYRIEPMDGYPIPIGYEDSCLKFYSNVINDAGAQKCVLENPVFVLYHGTLNDINTILPLLEKLSVEFGAFLNKASEYNHSNVVVVATAFSEQVLATFTSSFRRDGAVKILPLVIPKSPLQNSQSEFLNDMAAITGATVFDPQSFPLDQGELEHLGPGVTGFECSRYRSSVIGKAKDKGVYWEDMLVERLAVVEQQVEDAVSELDRILLRERYAKLSGGIVRLVVTGPSNGELKEKRDRAEDAVCAVRGAIQHGFLPGGGWALVKLATMLPDTDIDNEVLKPALLEPLHRLLLNAGYHTDSSHYQLISPIFQGIKDGKQIVYNVREDTYGDAEEMGLLDSTPAVREAVRNSMSIASLVGTLGGIVSFSRDEQLERTEARDVQEWLRDANINPADERP